MIAAAIVVKAAMVISVGATVYSPVVISVGDRAAKAVVASRRRDRGEGRDGDFRRRDRGEGRDGDFVGATVAKAVMISVGATVAKAAAIPSTRP